MLREVRVLSNRAIDCGEPFPAVNDRGTMALVFGEGNTVYGRGLYTDLRNLSDDPLSCLFEGYLDGGTLTVSRRIIGAADLPQTEHGEKVRGYEDPTFLNPEINWIEPGREGLLCTRAYWSRVEGKTGWTDADTFYVGLETGKRWTVIRPLEIFAQLSSRECDYLNLAKECQVSVDENGLYLEVGCQVRRPGENQVRGMSQIVRMNPGYQFGDASVFLSPMLVPGDKHWFCDHVSTAANPMPMPNGGYFMVFNGRDKTTWRPGVVEMNGDGSIIRISKPFLEPPAGVGPHDQKIAFGSDLREEEDGTYTFLYHAHDKYPCIARLEFVFD